MQTIGKMEDGCVLAVLAPMECNLLENVQATIDLMLSIRLDVRAPAAADAEIQSDLRILGKVGTPARPKIMRQSRSASAKPETGKPLCRTCGKPITRKKGQNGMTPKCCSEKCLKEFKRIYAREHWRLAHGKTTAEAKSGPAIAGPAAGVRPESGRPVPD